MRRRQNSILSLSIVAWILAKTERRIFVCISSLHHHPHASSSTIFHPTQRRTHHEISRLICSNVVTRNHVSCQLKKCSHQELRLTSSKQTESEFNEYMQQYFESVLLLFFTESFAWNEVYPSVVVLWVAVQASCRGDGLRQKSTMPPCPGWRPFHVIEQFRLQYATVVK